MRPVVVLGHMILEMSRLRILAAFLGLLVAVAAVLISAPHKATATVGLFSPGSIWNAPIPATAPTDPTSAAAVQEIVRQARPRTDGGYGSYIETTQYGVPIYTVPAGKPLVKVKLDVTSPLLAQAFAAGVPIPSGAKPSPGTDANMAVYQPDTDTLWEFWRLSKQADGWHAKWGGKMTHVSQSPGVYRNLKNSSGVYYERCFWGAPSSKFSLMAGVITINEMRNGNIPHALMLALHDVKAGVYSQPAQATDGRYTSTAAVMMGSRFRLDPALNVDATNVSAAMKVILHAAQTYGLVVANSSGSVSLRAEDPAQYGSNPWPSMMGSAPSSFMKQFPWNKLRMLPLQPKTGGC